MKKTLVLILSLVLALSMFACASAEEKTTITYWHHDASDNIVAAMEKILADFEEKNPDIDVEFLALPADSFYTKYQTAIATNTAPDVFGMRVAELSALVEMGAFAPLDELTQDWEEMGDINDAALTSVRVLAKDNLLYMMPWYSNVNTNWYNTKLLGELGIEVPKTIDEFFDCCEKVSDPENGKYFYTFRGGKSAWSNLIPFVMCYACIDSVFDENNECALNTPKAVEGLEKYISIYTNHWCSEDGINNSYKEMVLEFGSGTAAMMSHNNSSLPEHLKNLGDGNFDMEAAGFAGEDGKVRISMLEPIGVSISATTKHLEAATRLTEYLSSAEAMSYFCKEVGKFPMNEGVYDDEWLTSSVYMKKVSTIINDDSLVWFQLPQYLPEWYDISLQIDADCQAMCLGDKTAAEALASWAEQLTAAQQAYIAG